MQNTQGSFTKNRIWISKLVNKLISTESAPSLYEMLVTQTQVYVIIKHTTYKRYKDNSCQIQHSTVYSGNVRYIQISSMITLIYIRK
jgi:hypothetical protein